MDERTAPMGYQGAEMAASSLKPMSHRDVLVQQKREVETRLENINKAIEALDANPNIEAVLDLLGRTIGRF